MALHALLVLYSLSSVMSKFASGFEPLSLEFCLCYLAVLFLLGLYAIGWQQVLKRLPLTTAFANKAITVIWGFVWGVLAFGESLTMGKVVAALLIVVGIVLTTRDDAPAREMEASGDA